MKTIEARFEGAEPCRADLAAAQIAGVTRSRAAALIAEGAVTRNGRAVVKNEKVRPGDLLAVDFPDPRAYEVLPEKIPLDVVFEDDDLLVVNKPKGMVVHPAAGNESGTLVHALLFHCGESLSGINGVLRPGIVHRIDKNTSGLLIVAKNDLAHTALAAQIQEHSFTREYEAVVYGNVKNDFGTINAPIGRHPVKRKQMAIMPGGREAVTHYTVLRRFGSFTHVRLRLETGRTHQIRVHMAALGHPVAGDDVYGPKKVIKSLGGQCLHAKTIGFVHPRTGEYLEFDSPLPPYFTQFLERCGSEWGE